MPESARDRAAQRERVVLSHRRGARMVRTRVEVAEQTGIGEHLVRGLVRAQLALSLRLGLAVLAIFVTIPLMGATIRPFADATIAGLPLNWLILGLAPTPLLYLAGKLYIRLAEQAERDFVRLVDADLEGPEFDPAELDGPEFDPAELDGTAADESAGDR